jgi:tRNA 2-thiouridine synthesizing protein B
MPTLHLVNKSAALAACLRVAAADDSVLLLEDGVYAAAAGLEPAASRNDECRLYALQVDVVARGLAGRLAEQIELVSDDEFVALVVAHQPIVTWRS